MIFFKKNSLNGIENSIISNMIARLEIIAKHTPSIIIPTEKPAVRYWNITPIKLGPHLKGKANGNAKKTLLFKIFFFTRSSCQYAQSKKEIATHMFAIKENSIANFPQHKTANGILHKEINNAIKKDNITFFMTTSFFKC